MFVREDWELFLNLQTLAQKAGVSRRDLGAILVKELVDNALDAGSNVTLTEIEGKNGVGIVDDGPGIPGSDEEIADLFSVKRPLTSSKLLRRPTRGALGNGLRVVAGTIYCCGGLLSVATKGRLIFLSPQADGTTKIERVDPWDRPGTTIIVTLNPDNGIIIDQKKLALSQLAIQIARKAKTPSYRGLTQIEWYSQDDFAALCRAAKSGTLNDLVGHFVANPDKITIDKRCPASLTSAEITVLYDVLRTQTHRVVKAKDLGWIGDLGESTYACVEAATMTKIPYLVEMWIKQDENKEGGGTIITPLIINRTPVITSLHGFHNRKQIALSGCNVNHYIAKCQSNPPSSIMIGITSPYVPITSDGKAPDLEPFLSGIQACAKKAMRAYRSTTNKNGERTTQKELIYTCLPDAVNKANGSGQYQFSQRQLYYVVRPTVIEATGKAPDYNHFCRIVTDYENEAGEIELMYRDPRGILYHPHTGEVIQLGTINVREYSRPRWTFNKVLYIEKEGFIHLLRAFDFYNIPHLYFLYEQLCRLLPGINR